MYICATCGLHICIRKRSYTHKKKIHAPPRMAAHIHSCNIHWHIHTHIQTYTHTRTYTQSCNMHRHIHAHMQTFTHSHTQPQHASACPCTHTYTHTHTHTYTAATCIGMSMHTYIHTHIHTHTHTYTAATCIGMSLVFHSAYGGIEKTPMSVPLALAGLASAGGVLATPRYGAGWLGLGYAGAVSQ